MSNFWQLVLKLENAASDGARISLLNDYFDRASALDAACCVFYLGGHRSQSVLKVNQIKEWALAYAGISDWMFEQCYETVGDQVETISLILPPSSPSFTEVPLTRISQILTANENDPRRGALYAPVTQNCQKENVHQLTIESWQNLDDSERLVFNKLLTGTFRTPVHFQLLITSIAEHCGVDKRTIATRIAGDWEPNAAFWEMLCAKDQQSESNLHPYPFREAKVFEESLISSCGKADEWIVEWNWDGLRTQLVKRNNLVSLWSREDELLNAYFPELMKEASGIADGTVLDGVILAWKDADVMPMTMLQQRMGRNVTAKLLEEIPVIFMAFDCLEESGIDIRNRPIEYRRQRAEDLLSTRSQIDSNEKFNQLKLFAPCQTRLSTVLRLSPTLQAESWDSISEWRSDARKMKVAGVQFKRKGSAYDSDSTNDDWLEWKHDALTINAVLVAAQPEGGKRSGKFTDFTLALWKDAELLSFARVNADLPEEELLQIDSFVRENTIARYGPVRTVKPDLVFELAFYQVQPSQRYKSGVTAKDARILRWCHDKTAGEADSLNSIKELIPDMG